MLKFAALPAALLVAYAASPFMTLYEMGADMRRGDAAALARDIDWDSVRSGLKQDIAQAITGEPQAAPAVAQSSDDDLPPFGAGFVTNVAGGVVDRTVTPAHLAETLHAITAAHGAAPRPLVEEARFTSPTSFTIALLPTGEAGEAGLVRLRLDLVGSGGNLRWMVTRADIPPAMLEKTDTHTS